METFELRYFLSVARFQNIHKASEHIAVSPAALSKAVGRLESELGVKLFSRLGRNIALTEQGQVLQARAADIIRMEEAARLEIQGQEGRLNVVIAGPDIVLGVHGHDVVAELRRRYSNSSFEFLSVADEEALEMVGHGSAHLGLTTQPPPTGLRSRVVQTCVFQTVVGKGHPLFSHAKAGRKVPVERLLEFPFVCPSRGMLGRLQGAQSRDGWRDDVFPRRIEFVASSLKLIDSIVADGHGVAYLPDYLVARMDALPLSVSGCPYSCHQEIRLVARKPERVGWLKGLF